MKIIIFAGGTGRRLWPLSRQKSPKQFEPIIGEKSTVQLAVERVWDDYGPDNIYLSINQRYLSLIREQLPEIPADHFIGEPARRDLAAAVGLSMAHLNRRYGPDEPVAILWGDNYMSRTDTFRQVLQQAEKLIVNDKAKMVFIGETPRFANDNLGWIGLGGQAGQVDDRPYYAFDSWIYRPPLEKCQQMFAEGRYVWNTGYFVTTLGFVGQAYRQYQPEMWAQLQTISAAFGQDHYIETLNRIYPTLPEASFDDAIVANIGFEQAVILHGEMGWSDPGTLYALKEAVNPDTDANVLKGLVQALESKDCLLYNYDQHKLMAVAGLEGMIVINTSDALLVVHKDQIPLVKELVNSLIGTELEKYS